jgi:hypothetical protein
MKLTAEEREKIVDYLASYWAETVYVNEHSEFSLALLNGHSEFSLDLLKAMYRKVPWVSKSGVTTPPVDDLTDEGVVQEYLDCFDPLEPEDQEMDAWVARLIYNKALQG